MMYGVKAFSFHFIQMEEKENIVNIGRDSVRQVREFKKKKAQPVRLSTEI